MPIDCKEEIILKIIKTSGGKDEIIRKLEILRRAMLVDKWDDPKNIMKLTEKLFEAKTIDKIQEAWMASILSSPTTQAANIIGNSMAFLTRFPEKILSATVDTAKSLLPGAERHRFFGEVAAETFGMWTGIKEGVRRAIYTMAHELPEGALTKLDLARAAPAMGGTIGKIIRFPFRLLTATDEFFRSLNYQTEIHALAYRNAAKKIASGGKNEGRIAEIAKLIANPTDDMIIRSARLAQENVFQKELGSLGSAALKIRNDPMGKYFLPFVIPFVRTPINLTKFGLKRTPVNIPIAFRKLMRSNKLRAAQERGVKLNAAQRKQLLSHGDVSDELAKTIMGSFIGGTAMIYAKEGLITGGGPIEPNARKAWERTHQPYSIRVGDKWISYARLEPMTIPLGLAADWAGISDFVEDGILSSEAVSSIIFSISKNVTNKTFMQGLSRAFNALSDPDRYGNVFIEGLIGSLIPAGVANIAGAIDPTIRKREGVIDALKSRVGATADLIPRRDLWGRALKKTDLPPLLAAISPIRVRSITGDKVEEEMERMNINTAPPNIKELRGLELTPKELDNYIVESGELSKRLLDNILQGRGYDKLADPPKEELIRKVIRFSRRAAGSRLLIKKIRSSQEAR